MRSSTIKLRKSQEKTNYTRQNNNSLDRNKGKRVREKVYVLIFSLFLITI